MRKVVLKMHVSLGGYVRAASGDVMDWVFRTYHDELKAWEVDLLWQAGTHIMGRRLYEEMAAYWPTSPGTVNRDNPDNKPGLSRL